MSARKRRVLVVGGLAFNIPKWADRAFDIELITGDKNGKTGGTGFLSPTNDLYDLD